MKTHFRNFSIFVCLAFCSVNVVFAQQNNTQEHYYLVEFEQMDQQSVKPLIGMLMPLFKEVPHLQEDAYNLFYYKSADLIEIAAVEKLIESQTIEMLEFEEISKRSYTAILNAKSSKK
ncbi:MAG: hypothetical protein ACI8V8_002173 [Chitinophagales bacterium]|jgi:hypothetical protein